MLAEQLETILRELCRKADASLPEQGEITTRFSALRGYGRLPRGRENRGRPLSDCQIAAAVLGLASVLPGWAGHAAAILERLQPVGGVGAGFGRAATFGDAIVATLQDAGLRGSVIAVRMSLAEGGTNSNGLASVEHEDEGRRRITSYVSPLAVSLTAPGAGADLDPSWRHAPFGREATFGRPFLEKVAVAVSRARANPRPPIGDGTEYDEGDAQRARARRIGATCRSRYLNVSVDNQVTWPREETLVRFDGHTLVLMPKTRDNVQSAHIDLEANGLTDAEALTLLNRMLSVMTFCDDQFAIAQDGWSGNPMPIGVPRRDLAFSTTRHWLFDRSSPDNAKGRRALALYREGRNAEQNFMVGFAVLSYYKIIEIRHQGAPASMEWVRTNLKETLAEDGQGDEAAAFLAACGDESPELYIYAACRVAVAHASPNRASDPDESGELRRLHIAARVMRQLARRFIKKELGISDLPWTEEAGG